MKVQMLGGSAHDHGNVRQLGYILVKQELPRPELGVGGGLIDEGLPLVASHLKDFTTPQSSTPKQLGTNHPNTGLWRTLHIKILTVWTTAVGKMATVT